MTDPVEQYNEDEEAKVKGVKVYRGDELILRLKEVRGVAHYSSHRHSGLKKKISDKLVEFQNKKNDDEDDDEDEDPNKNIKVIAVVILFAIVFYMIL